MADAEQRRLRILIVDDDPVSLAILHQYLVSAGHDVLAAADAGAAMAVLERETVQIIVADWMMPGVDGLELCRRVRERFAPRPPHFAMLTAHADKGKLVEAFEAGVDDFLAKPLHRNELLARLRAWSRLVALQEELASRHEDAVRVNEDLAGLNARLSELATQDELTGLSNRREATRRLREQFAISQRYGHPLACGMIDLDRFKGINDTHGHAFGDAALRHVAQTLRAYTRTADGVFRLGGDEFFVLLPNQTTDGATKWGERFRRAMAERPVTYGATTAAVTVSVGLAAYDPAFATPEAMLAAADAALYAAKRGGRDAVHASLPPAA